MTPGLTAKVRPRSGAAKGLRLVPPLRIVPLLRGHRQYSATTVSTSRPLRPTPAGGGLSSSPFFGVLTHGRRQLASEKRAADGQGSQRSPPPGPLAGAAGTPGRPRGAR